MITALAVLTLRALLGLAIFPASSTALLANFHDAAAKAALYHPIDIGRDRVSQHGEGIGVRIAPGRGAANATPASDVELAVVREATPRGTVPEAAATALFGLGLLALSYWTRRHRR